MQVADTPTETVGETRPAAKRLVVTADDFGVAREVNEAVQHGHLHGILTAASLMVGGAAIDDAVSRARSMPSLRVGLHLVLVEGRPTLPPAAIPDLVDSRGRFRTDMAWTAVEMFARPGVRRQLAEEIAAQFEAFRATGLRLDHVNAHKHFHLHPTIARAIVRIGRAYGMRAMRVPLEPRSVLRAAEPGGRLGTDCVVDAAARLLRRRLKTVGVRVPDAVYGVAWSGAMKTARVRGLIEHLGDGLSEIYLHPALGGSFECAVPGYSYEEELLALTDAEVVAAAQEPHITRGGFSDFCDLS